MCHQINSDLKVRYSRPADHKNIIAVLKDWWGGRDLSWMLPKLFLIHFCNTSFVVEKDEALIAFLIAFLSPARPNEGYIHFSGVHPDFRRMGIGKSLYDLFFDLCKENDRKIIRACTSPVNKESIEFHQSIGFKISNGGSEIDGVQVTLNYNRPNDPKVRFEIEI